METLETRLEEAQTTPNQSANNIFNPATTTEVPAPIDSVPPDPAQAGIPIEVIPPESSQKLYQIEFTRKVFGASIDVIETLERIDFYDSPLNDGALILNIAYLKFWDKSGVKGKSQVTTDSSNLSNTETDKCKNLYNVASSQECAQLIKPNVEAVVTRVSNEFTPKGVFPSEFTLNSDFELEQQQRIDLFSVEREPPKSTKEIINAQLEHIRQKYIPELKQLSSNLSKYDEYVSNERRTDFYNNLRTLTNYDTTLEESEAAKNSIVGQSIDVIAPQQVFSDFEEAFEFKASIIEERETTIEQINNGTFEEPDDLVYTGQTVVFDEQVDSYTRARLKYKPLLDQAYIDLKRGSNNLFLTEDAAEKNLRDLTNFSSTPVAAAQAYSFLKSKIKVDAPQSYGELLDRTYALKKEADTAKLSESAPDDIVFDTEGAENIEVIGVSTDIYSPRPRTNFITSFYDNTIKKDKIDGIWQFLFNPEDLEYEFGPEYDFASTWGNPDGQPPHWKNNKNETIKFSKIKLNGYMFGRKVESLVQGIRDLVSVAKNSGQTSPQVVEFLWGKKSFGPALLHDVSIKENMWDNGDVVNAEMDFKLTKIPEWVINDGLIDIFDPTGLPLVLAPVVEQPVEAEPTELSAPVSEIEQGGVVSSSDKTGINTSAKENEIARNYSSNIKSRVSRLANFLASKKPRGRNTFGKEYARPILDEITRARNNSEVFKLAISGNTLRNLRGYVNTLETSFDKKKLAAAEQAFIAELRKIDNNLQSSQRGKDPKIGSVSWGELLYSKNAAAGNVSGPTQTRGQGRVDTSAVCARLKNIYENNTGGSRSHPVLIGKLVLSQKVGKYTGRIENFFKKSINNLPYDSSAFKNINSGFDSLKSVRGLENTSASIDRYFQSCRRLSESYANIVSFGLQDLENKLTAYLRTKREDIKKGENLEEIEREIERIYDSTELKRNSNLRVDCNARARKIAKSAIDGLRCK